MLTPQLVSELIRQRAGWTDDSQAARVINLIPQALKETARKLVADPWTRELLITDRATTLISIGNDGQVNLETGYDNYQFLLEYFDKGQIYFLPRTEIAGTAATGSITIQPTPGTAATGYLTVSVPSGHSTGTLTVRQGVQAVGTYTVATLPTNGQTIVVNGRSFTFQTSAVTPVQIQIQTNFRNQAATIAQTITAYAVANPSSGVAAATYTSLGGIVNITSIYYSTTGNSFTTVGNGNVTAQQATLTGGVDGVTSGESIYVNGVQCVFAAGVAPSPTIYVGEPSADATENASNLAQGLSASTSLNLTVASYSTNSNVVTITYEDGGAIGNTFVLASSTNITASGANLTGGTGGIVQGETLTIGNSGGVTFTFSNFNASTPTNTFLPFSSNGDAAESADLIAEALNTKTDVKLSVATYSQSYPPPPLAADETLRAILITYDTVGTGGNSYALGNSSGSGITRNATTLRGGTGGTVVTNETIVINGVTITFKTSAGAFPEVQIGGSPTATATNLRTGLSASTNPLLTLATYASSGPVVTITYRSYGTSGNLYTLTLSSLYGAIPSGPTLTGGSGGVNVTDDTFTIDSYVNEFANLDRVRFTTTDIEPTPIVIGNDYYIVNYTIDDDGLSATFQIADNADGTSIVDVTDSGSGILSVMKYGGSGYPMQQLANPQLTNLPQYLRGEFDYFVIEGNNLNLLPIDSVYPVGQVGFATPFFPTNLATLPDSTEVERVFLQELMNLVGVPVMDSAV